jgi:hypothetical protein
MPPEAVCRAANWNRLPRVSCVQVWLQEHHIFRMPKHVKGDPLCGFAQLAHRFDERVGLQLAYRLALQLQ